MQNIYIYAIYRYMQYIYAKYIYMHIYVYVYIYVYIYVYVYVYVYIYVYISVHSKELVPLLFLCKYCLIHYKFHYHEEFLSILLAEVESTVLPDFLHAKFPPLLIMASLKNRIFRIPARQLNSKRVENSLKANIIPLVSTDLLLP